MCTARSGALPTPKRRVCKERRVPKPEDHFGACNISGILFLKYILGHKLRKPSSTLLWPLYKQAWYLTFTVSFIEPLKDSFNGTLF